MRLAVLINHGPSLRVYCTRSAAGQPNFLMDKEVRPNTVTACNLLIVCIISLPITMKSWTNLTFPLSQEGGKQGSPEGRTVFAFHFENKANRQGWWGIK